jgi:hypothetical protein
MQRSWVNGEWITGRDTVTDSDVIVTCSAADRDSESEQFSLLVPRHNDTTSAKTKTQVKRCMHRIHKVVYVTVNRESVTEQIELIEIAPIIT